MRRHLVRTFYYLSRALGLFALSRLVTKNGLRILCYHGFSLDNEERWRGGLFIRPEEFERRLEFLDRGRFPVLSLDQAIARQAAGTLPPCATVITIDDGFYSVYRHAFTALRHHSFPATLYLTTYYFVKEAPIFRLTISYMLWATEKGNVDLTGIGVPDLADTGDLDLDSPGERERIESVIIEHGEERCDEPTRCAIARRLATQLGVDYDAIVDSRMLSLVNESEFRELVASGVDIELHTHRHNFPVDTASAAREISENRAALMKILSEPPRHFCYPSGQWSRDHWPILNANGVATATTCDPGLVYLETPRYALNRFLDSSRMSQIEFEAHMSGYSGLVRVLRSLFGRCFNRVSA